MSRKWHRGYTLIELLITLSLVLLLFNLAYQVMLPALHIWIVNQAQAAIEDSALVLESRITKELERSSYRTLTSVQPPPGLPGLQAMSFASWGWPDQQDVSDGYDPSNAIVTFYRFVIYYIPTGSQNVYRKSWPVWPASSGAAVAVPPMGTGPGALDYHFTTTHPQALSIADLKTLCATPNGTEKQVASNTTHLEMDILAGDSVGNTVVTTSSTASLIVTMETAAPSTTHLQNSLLRNAVQTTRSQVVELRI